MVGSGLRFAVRPVYGRAEPNERTSTSARNAAILNEVLIVLLLVAANGVFSGAEIAVVAVRKTRLVELTATGQRSATAVLALREHPERFLATVQVGITVVGASAAAFGGASIARHLVPFFERVSWLAEHAEALALGLVVALVSYLSIVLGELVPKSLALRGSERIALLVGRPLLGLSWLVQPLVWFLTKSSNWVLRPFGDQTSFTEARHSVEELQQLVEEAMDAGTVHREAGEIASRALEFPELRAADVMVPRPQVVMLPRSASHEELRRIMLEHSHTRMPVYEGTIDNVVGYVSVKDVLALAWDQKLLVLEDIIRPPYFAPETQGAVELLQAMRQKHAPFAIVVDEQGGLAGIVTIEDLVEELVGDIFNEHRSELPIAITTEPGGSVIVPSGMKIRELNRQLEFELPDDGDWNTIGGLLIALAGHIPQIGERLEIGEQLEVEVLDASSRRVKTVRIHRKGASSQGDGPT